MTSGQVTRSQKGTMSGPNFNYFYAPVPHTVSDRFPSNFLGVLISSGFYIADLRSAGGHDFVMLSLWKNIQVTSFLKILEIAASFYNFCSSMPHYVTIHDKVCLCSGSNKVN